MPTSSWHSSEFRMGSIRSIWQKYAMVLAFSYANWNCNTYTCGGVCAPVGRFFRQFSQKHQHWMERVDKIEQCIQICEVTHKIVFVCLLRAHAWLYIYGTGNARPKTIGANWVLYWRMWSSSRISMSYFNCYLILKFIQFMGIHALPDLRTITSSLYLLCR